MVPSPPRLTTRSERRPSSAAVTPIAAQFSRRISVSIPSTWAPLRLAQPRTSSTASAESRRGCNTMPTTCIAPGPPHVTPTPPPGLHSDVAGAPDASCHTPRGGYAYAAAKQGDALRRDRRGPEPGPDDGQPRLPARAGPHPRCQPLAVETLDLLSAELQGRAARPHAARPVDGAVLPRRGHRARRRAPALRILPPR